MAVVMLLTINISVVGLISNFLSYESAYALHPYLP